MSNTASPLGEIDREPHIGEIMDALGVVPTPGMRVLIIDPTHCRLAKWCAVRQMDVHVVCLSEKSTNTVRAECGPGINVFRLAPSGFLAGCTPQSFQLIICVDWPSHPDKLELLAQSRKALNWGGELVIVCPETGEAARLAQAMEWEKEYLYKSNLSTAHRCLLWKKEPGWLISSYPRCGTHMLLTALEEHPWVSVLGEVFNPHHPAGTHGLTGVQQVLEACWVAPNYGLAMHAYIGRKGGVAGFQPPAKLFERIWDHLPRGIRVVGCRRRNLLARHVSHLKARETKVWFGDNKQPIKKSVRVEAMNLIRDMEYVRECWRLSDQFWPHQHVVFYEDLVTDYTATMRGVQEYLGIPVTEIHPHTTKLGRSLRDDIENFGHLRQSLAGKVPDEWFKE